ncbi:MAG: DNA repair protein RadA [Tetragenococcus halophilus]|uniref:DNA repair protein RadA n=1 Tax=Tetragenococcus halophilus (strain DSM 20338 / JCM 20259 / NCIMB 9735 / NBRC 12172) TaxID=945021 RepID=A0AAN1VPS8_TETHN|nr:DNA repair protein RadA [Tetragenococcus halophilus]MCO8288451.1 DNA repair protein RadA [Tetragenococcus halophilus]MDN6127305.1 DNA repair protein RadA [Tetragenococcus halophilus]MDN6723560.1 DNA repair protein RadA [Tetragenococcus halophilus]QXN86902.1 DNA repair protein RadA [Tetragenococcus halophilus]RQD30959.1 DNA repair protein RadA [Tetragenococcus halophilus subsp. halophilus DSM 20339]
MAKKVKTQFECQNCGYISPRYLGKCPNCGSWNSMVEEKLQDTTDRRNRTTLTGSKMQPTLLKDVVPKKEPRVKTSLDELNRVLGGGVVPGSMILLGGDPGIGKSTLLLQVSQQLAATGGTVLYVSGEESAEQIKLRAQRLGDAENDFYLFAETGMQDIRETIEKLQPDYVIIDSIQTMTQPDISSVAGSVSQVRETTAELLKIAKSNEIAVFVVGHVTKEGSIAGPRMLEHMVDTVLYFEGDKYQSFRILRAVKNRFGSTNEIGIFEMYEQGLKEVSNPSQVFLEERLEGTSGSAIVVAMEGTRPILVEIQALVTPTMFGNAKRTATGLDFNRVSLIMAVLEKRAGLLLQNQDAYLKAAGGVKLNEPAIDLAIAISIASSYKEKGTKPTECFIGEIGLTGEIRRVSAIEQRVKEVQKLGFEKVYIPKNNLSGWKAPADIEVVGIATLDEALKRIFR